MGSANAHGRTVASAGVWECAKRSGAPKGDRIHSDGQAGGYQVIGPGYHPSPSPGVGQVPGHRSALGADGLQGASAQVDGCLTAAMNMQK